MIGLGEHLGERLVEGFRFVQPRLRRADKGSICIAAGNVGPPNQYEWADFGRSTAEADARKRDI